ncbi:MAG: hypothetical protein AB1374_12040 [Bacillota bacterium]
MKIEALIDKGLSLKEKASEDKRKLRLVKIEALIDKGLSQHHLFHHVFPLSK